MKQIELTFETKRLCISEIKTEITGTFISAKEINNQIIHQEMREWPLAYVIHKVKFMKNNYFFSQEIYKQQKK